MAVLIDPRFNGPPDSGHGGYSAGRAAALLAPGPREAVEVTLRRPVPLGVPLSEERTGDAVEVTSGGELVMSARAVEPAEADPGPVAPVSALEADRAARSVWGDDHPFPGCFGCGPDRDPADALRLFCGPLGDGRFAVPWTPAPWTGDGVVAPEFVWAALDCPSAAPAVATVSGPLVLGRFTVALEAAVVVGTPCVIAATLERSDGRKRFTGVSLLEAESGERLAAGRAIWFELPG